METIIKEGSWEKIEKSRKENKRKEQVKRNAIDEGYNEKEINELLSE